MWLVAESVKYDLVCITGDLLNFGCADVPPDAQAARIEPYLRSIKAPLALCSGNHDCADVPGWFDGEWLSRLRSKNIRVDGDVFWWNDFRVRCVGYSQPISRCDEDIWLIHVPPARVRTSTTRTGDCWGSDEFADMCALEEGPSLALSGHVHSPLECCTLAGGTMSLNPGQGSDALIPNYIVVDFETGVLRHHYSDEQGIHSKGYTFREHLTAMLH